MDWFLYNKDLRDERVKESFRRMTCTLICTKKKKFKNVHKRVIKLLGIKENKAYTSINSRGAFRENPAKQQVFS